MTNFLQKFSTDAIHRGSTRDNRDFTTPSRFASHPFKKLKRNLFPNLTVLRSYCLMVFLFIFFLPSSVYSQLYWEGTIDAYKTGGEIHDNIILTGDVNVYVESGILWIYGEISGNHSLTKSGPAQLVFMNDNKYTGLTKVNDGSLHLGADSEKGSVMGNIVNNGILDFARTVDVTYSGVISGTGTVVKSRANKVTLTGKNTYTGPTFIAKGTLALGTTGSIEDSWNVIFTDDFGATLDISAGDKTIQILSQEVLDHNVGTTNKVILGEKTLTIGIAGQPCNNGFFTGTISGTGGIIKTGGAQINLAGNNTFTGITTVNEGRLAIQGNYLSNSIVLNTEDCVLFARETPQTYSGVISGTGFVAKQGAGTLTLNGANTFTGDCHFYDGTIVLGPNGSIENSGAVHLINANAKLDISAGNKKIINLYGVNTAEIEVILGTKTLTLESGDFIGKFTGSGDVIKTGAGNFVMNGENKTTGKFSLNGGAVEFSKEWAGNFTQAAGTNLVVKGNAIIGGTCLLMGGKISMDLTKETPSKLIVMGAASTPGKGKTELNIKTNEITDYVLISAASGLNESAFTLGVPESVAKLSAPNNGKQLLLTAYQNMLDIETITNDELQITVYPNPTTGKFNVQSSKFKVQSVEIFDVFGRKVYDDNNSYGLMVLRSYDLTPIPAGVYFLKITTETGMVTKKIIKQ